MIIAVASGKGGTGKTTLTVNLARSIDTEIQLLDCDVEEPNAHLFLKGNTESTEVISIPVPEINTELCDGCGECSRFCEYNAIACAGSSAIVFPKLCHGCGGCLRVCPQGAIREIDNRIGVIETSKLGNIELTTGRLDVGVAMAPPLIRAVKSRFKENSDILLDAPPGTSCPVIAAIRDSDVVILITEPTPFGLNDLKLAVGMVRTLGIPFGVVVNRVGIGDDRVHTYCRLEGIPLLMGIPNDRKIAEAYSRGELIVDRFPEYHLLFQELLIKAKKLRHVRAN